MISTGYGNEQKSALPDSLGLAAREELHRVLEEQSVWVKVHAAEYLLWAGFPEGVEEVFLKEEERFGGQAPYRIGIWRVLAQAATTKEEREKWITRIQQAFQDTAGADRIHAAETLAKLGVPPSAREVGLTRQAIESENPALSMYARWAAAYYSSDSVAHTKDYLLDGLGKNKNGEVFRRMGAYILRHLGDLTDSQWNLLVRAAMEEPEESDARIYLLSAAFVKAPAQAEASPAFRKIRKNLLKARTSPQKGDRSEMAMALAERGNIQELSVLIALLENKNPLEGAAENDSKDADNADVRAAAAYAILKIKQRN